MAIKKTAALQNKIGSMRKRGNASSHGENKPVVDKFDLAAKLVSGEGQESIVTLPLSNLTANPLNARKFYKKRVIDDLAASLRADGQLVPLLVTRDTRDDSWLVIDGHYRLKALQLAGFEDARCEVKHDVSGLALYLVSRVTNETRSPQSVFDDAVAFKKLINEGHVDKAETLALAVGISTAQMSKYLSISSIDERIMEVLNEHPAFGIRSAYGFYSLTKNMDYHDSLTLAERVTDEVWSSQQIETQIETARKRASNRNKSAADKPVTIFNKAGKKVGAFALKGRKLSLSFQAESPEKAEAIAKAIEKILNENDGVNNV
jgi:ParB family chromosome partitioning protein